MSAPHKDKRILAGGQAWSAAQIEEYGIIWGSYPIAAFTGGVRALSGLRGQLGQLNRYFMVLAEGLSRISCA